MKISFYYSELNGKKKEVLKNDGKPYTVSPFDLIWDGDYYYLTGCCDEREAVRTYRVDRIKKQPEIMKEKAVKKPKGYNVSKYTTEVFRMFSTDEAVDVTLRCDTFFFWHKKCLQTTNIYSIMTISQVETNCFQYRFRGSVK